MKSNANQVFITATIRAFIIAFATGLVTATTSLTSGSDDRTAIIVGLGAFGSSLILRMVGEGGYDANRARKGNVKAGDVGRSVTTKVTVNKPVDKTGVES